MHTDETLELAPLVARLRSYGHLRCPQCDRERKILALWSAWEAPKWLGVLDASVLVWCRQCNVDALIRISAERDILNAGELAHLN